MTSPLTAVGEERLREILAGCEDVTPGPWNYSRGNKYVSGFYGSVNNRQIAVKPDGNLTDKEADFAHIARLAPDTVKELCRLALIGLEAERSPVPEGDGLRPTHRHVKRGSEYVLIGFGKMQAEDWIEPGIIGLVPGGSVDMREVAIYRSATDPTEIWVRPREEFEDGRFIALANTNPTGAE